MYGDLELLWRWMMVTNHVHGYNTVRFQGGLVHSLAVWNELPGRCHPPLN